MKIRGFWPAGNQAGIFFRLWSAPTERRKPDMFWWNAKKENCIRYQLLAGLTWNIWTKTLGSPILPDYYWQRLTNPWRSLIRFDVGDLVEIDTTGACPCGCKRWLYFRQISGRSANLTYSVNGLPVTTASVEEFIAGCSEVAEYQVFQQAGRYDVRIVAHRRYCLIFFAARESTWTDNWRTLPALSQAKIKIDVHFTDQIQTEPSGKYRRTISDIELAADRQFLKGSWLWLKQKPAPVMLIAGGPQARNNEVIFAGRWKLSPNKSLPLLYIGTSKWRRYIIFQHVKENVRCSGADRRNTCSLIVKTSIKKSFEKDSQRLWFDFIAAEKWPGKWIITRT